MSYSRVYTADTEEPDCGRCDHVCDDQEYCNETCGAENFWNGYERIEYIEESVKEKYPDYSDIE